MYQLFHPWFPFNIFFVFVEKERFIQFYGPFDHFSWTYEVAKFSMIKLYLEVTTSYTQMNIHDMLIVAYM